MESLYQKFKGPDFEILAVSIDTFGEETVRPFVTKHNLTFPILLDPDSTTYRLYGLTGVPETFVIDKDGVVLLKVVGARDWTKKEWIDYFKRRIGRE